MANLVAELRRLVPMRTLTLNEAMRVAELQANRLLERFGIEDGPVPETVVSALPRIQVDRMSPMPISGSAHWSNGRWVIVVNGSEPGVRQRFSLAHELKHVLDAPMWSTLYKGKDAEATHERAEQISDHFAACLLMPRMWVKRAFRGGTQDLSRLARMFSVSQMAMNVRLQTIGLVEPPKRCNGRRKSR